MSEHTARLNAPPETLDEDPPLSRLMTHRLLGVTPDAELDVALRLLATTGFRHLPVLDGNRCVGVLIEADVLRALTQPRPALGPPRLVADLCRTAPALGPLDRRASAAAAMSDAGVDAVLVVERGRLLGIVTATDLVRSLVPHTSSPQSGTAPESQGTSGPGRLTIDCGIVVR